MSVINFNEKLLDYSLKLMNNDLEMFNKLKKYSKGFETIIENDIPCLTDNNYEIVIKKAQYQKNKMSELLYDVENIITIEKSINQQNSLSEHFKKLNEFIKIYKENFISVYNLLNKTFNKVIELCQIKRNIKEEIEEFTLQRKNEEKNNKNKIFEIILNSLDEFKPICYSADNSDLKEELNNLKKESEEFNQIEIMKKATDIMKKIIIRSADFRLHKEKEIKSLNNKISYLLSEIENYKKYYNNHKINEFDEEKRLLNSQLFLQDGEIIRLNRENDKLLKIIENLMNTNEEINIDINNN